MVGSLLSGFISYGGGGTIFLSLLSGEVGVVTIGSLRNFFQGSHSPMRRQSKRISQNYLRHKSVLVTELSIGCAPTVTAGLAYRIFRQITRQPVKNCLFSIFSGQNCNYSLKRHSSLRGRADLDTSFLPLKTINPPWNQRTSRIPPQSSQCLLDFRSLIEKPVFEYLFAQIQ